MINVVDGIKSLILGCVFVVVSASVCASPMDYFAGEWDWGNSSATMTFSIDLKNGGVDFMENIVRLRKTEIR